MLYKTPHASGRTLVHSKPLLIKAKDVYVRPAQSGREWFQTSTSIWNVDELIKRRVRDWRRLTEETGHSGERTGTFREDHNSHYTGTHSVFPAPLMEWIIMRFGGPPGGKILDAFAGGPPRGLVASIMGHEYWGFDVRQAQIDENLRVLKSLSLTGANYVLGDGCKLEFDQADFDAAITCPPYFDLEVYSGQSDDISNLKTYDAFNAAMRGCAKAHWDKLKPGAFVCIIVGPIRDKKTGEVINFPAHTVANFQAAGFIYWQEVILSKNFGSAAKRASNAWKGHKLVPRHEYMLVFRKPENDKRRSKEKVLPV